MGCETLRLPCINKILLLNDINEVRYIVLCETVWRRLSSKGNTPIVLCTHKNKLCRKERNPEPVTNLVTS